MPADRDEETARLYRSATGREPARLPDDHPDAWQWAYRGTPAERALLRRVFGLEPLENERPPPAELEGQESLL